MRLLLIIAITAMATFSLTAADLAGTWKGSMKFDVTGTQGDKYTLICTRQ
jgi:hypothetical protein